MTVPPGRALDLIGLGECMVELYADVPLGSARTLSKAYGGDVLNSLVTAARLGARTGFITRVGDDPFGAGLLQAWRAEGLDTSRAPLHRGENGVYFISLQDGGEREFTYRRAGSAASGLCPEDLDEPYLASGRALLLSGITQALSASAQAATLEAAHAARRVGTLVAYDPNYRPRLWQDRGGVAGARAAYRELLPFVQVLCPSAPADLPMMTENAELLEALLPEALTRAFGAGVAVVALKAGSAGASIYTPATQHHLNAAPIARVLDTTGAGDAWNGTFLYRLVQGADAPDAAEQANRVAAATLAYRGAIPAR